MMVAPICRSNSCRRSRSSRERARRQRWCKPTRLCAKRSPSCAGLAGWIPIAVRAALDFLRFHGTARPPAAAAAQAFRARGRRGFDVSDACRPTRRQKGDACRLTIRHDPVQVGDFAAPSPARNAFGAALRPLSPGPLHNATALSHHTWRATHPRTLTITSVTGQNTKPDTSGSH
jgi:hypothetical protein